MSGSLSEDSAETKKLPDKTRMHAFILELEQGSQEALKQRSVGKFDRLPRKELHSKERREKERSVSDERTKLKSKQADESQQRDGAALKIFSEEKTEKKPKIKSEKKLAGTAKDGKSSLSEVGAEEAALKKAKAPSLENIKVEKEKSREREKERSKEKAKGEKTSAKSDFKQTSRHESVSLFEDRGEVDLGSEASKKKEKHSKDILKRSKSHGDDRAGDKSRKEAEREKTKIDQEGQKSNKSSAELDREPKKVKLTEKGKTTEKSKSKSKEETKTSSKMDVKAQGLQAKNAGAAPAYKEKKKDAKEPRKVTEDTQHNRSEVKIAKKKKEKRDGSQEERKMPRGDKQEKSEKSSKFSATTPVSLVAEEPVQKATRLPDDLVASAAADTTATAGAAASLLDDTCDTLSDITPEPPEGELESRLAEMSAVPGETDALLTLMDVCTSAEARLPPTAAAQMSECEADMKMKEAALTLLSMDCGAVTCQDIQGQLVEPPLQPPPPSVEMRVERQEKEEEQEHCLPAEVTAAEPPAASKQASEQPKAEGGANTAGTFEAITHDDGQ